MIEVLLLARHMEHEHVVAGLAAAIRAGALTADAVALEARKAAEGGTRELPAPAVGTGYAEGMPRPATLCTRLTWKVRLLFRAAPKQLPGCLQLAPLSTYGDSLSRQGGEMNRTRAVRSALVAVAATASLGVGATGGRSPEQTAQRLAAGL